MSRSNQEFEWYLRHEDEANAMSWQSPAVDDALKPKQQHWSFELILGIVVIYGIAILFIGQQVAQRTSELEQEITALRREVVQVQAEAVESDVAFINKQDATPSYQVETDFLHFVASQRTADLVKRVAPLSETKYRQLHKDFDLPLPSQADKLTVKVDIAANVGHLPANEDSLVAPFPKFVAEQNGISEIDALTNELFIGLSGYVLDKAVKSRKIKSQWNGVVLALKAYLRLENGHIRDWKTNSFYLSHRHLAQGRSLDLVLHTNIELDAQVTEKVVSLKAYETADPLIEFILETYGYASIPKLLDAFEAHEMWETLALELFNLSAAEFEEAWHSYSREQYPIAK